MMQASFSYDCSSQQTLSAYKFTGKERDSESGLDYFGARHYASSMGRWMVPDLVNVTEDRVVNPANTLNKYVYGGNNPLKYVDPDGRDITYFYDQGGIAGHAILFAYNQATGDSAIESFGPEYHLPIAPGESMYEMSSFTSADDLRDKLTSLTIQTTPELAQQVIDYIRANPDPALWVYAGPNCSSQVWKILQKFKLAHKNSRLDGRPGNTPRNLWGNLIQQNNPFHQGLNPKNGVDYGNNRFDMFNLMWLSLPQSQPKGTVTVTVTNCVTDDKGKKVCDTQ
jgi:RHS repeat-associated protein